MFLQIVMSGLKKLINLFQRNETMAPYEIEMEVKEYIEYYHPHLSEYVKKDRMKQCLNLINDINNKHEELLTPEEAYRFLFER